MIIEQYEKPYVHKYANYDYVKVYDGNDKFIGWIKIYNQLIVHQKEQKNDQTESHS